jgi:hypothetical protein
MQMLQFAMNRQYITPELVTTLMQAGREDPNQIATPILQHILTEKVGLDSDSELLAAIEEYFIPTATDDTDAQQEAKEDLETYLQSTEAYQEFMNKREKQGNAEENLEEPLGRFLIEHTHIDALVSWKGIGPNRLNVHMQAAREPLFTNGQWNGDEGRVTWSGNISSRQEKYHNLPRNCYAMWVTPDEAAQTAKFGKIVLDGEELAEYALWRNGLSELEAEQWDALLDDLTPRTVEDKLDDFTFEGDDEPAVDKYAPLKNIYVNAVGQEKDEERDGIND